MSAGGVVDVVYSANTKKLLVRLADAQSYAESSADTDTTDTDTTTLNDSQMGSLEWLQRGIPSTLPATLRNTHDGAFVKGVIISVRTTAVSQLQQIKEKETQTETEKYITIGNSGNTGNIGNSGNSSKTETSENSNSGSIDIDNVFDYDFQSRYFAPWVGIPEDPVTGSAHTVLAPYWHNQLGLPTGKALKARQCR